MPRTPDRIILIAFCAFALFMVFLNALPSDGNNGVWALWPIWGVSIPVAGILGGMRMRRHRFLGVWLGAGLTLMIGLIAIDLFVTDGTPWSFWPVGVWMVVTAILVGLTIDVLGMVPTSQPIGEDERGALPADDTRSLSERT
jgi:hypothetical protein